MTGNQVNQVIKQVFFFVLLFGLICLIINELHYFISSFLGAFTLYMLLRKLHRKLLDKGWNKLFTTSLLLTMTILLVFVVGGAVIGAVYNKVKDFHPQIVIDNVNNMHDVLLEKTGYDIFSKDIADKAIRSVTEFLPNIFLTTGSILVNGMMMVFILFFMLQQSREMESVIENNLPLSKNSISLLKNETQNMVVSNAIGIPVILIGQALIAGLGYWILGAGDPIVWGSLTGICGLIPVIGTAGIWLPLAINLFIAGDIWQGVTLMVYGGLIISSVDNLIRMVFLKKYANIHPLVTIFGIIIGMNLFGFWGIIFGPLLVSGCMLMLKIYKSEFLID